MKLTKESLKQVIKEELESVLSEQERTGLLEIGNDNNFGPVLVFSISGESQVIEVFSSKLKLSNEWVNHMASKKGQLLGTAFSDAPAWFAKKFPAPYNDPEKLAGLIIQLQSSY